MKSIAAFLCLAFAASLAHAQTSPAANPEDNKSVPAQPAVAAPVAGKPVNLKAAPAQPVVVAPVATKPVDPKAAPTSPAPAKKEVKKEAPLPKIPGTVINRPNGTFLGLEVVGGNLKLTFYDKKHKPMAVDVTRANARWPNPRSVVGPNKTVLNGSGTALVGQKPVLPPFNFTVHLNLLQGEGDDAKVVESYDAPVSG